MTTGPHLHRPLHDRHRARETGVYPSAGISKPTFTITMFSMAELHDMEIAYEQSLYLYPCAAVRPTISTGLSGT